MLAGISKKDSQGIFSQVLKVDYGLHQSTEITPDSRIQKKLTI